MAGAALAVEGFTGIRSHEVDFGGIDHRLQGAIHRRESYFLVTQGERFVDLLGTDKRVGLLQVLANDSPLAGSPPTGFGER